MSVTNGQLANQTTFNTAFVSRTIDTSLVGVLTLSNTGYTSVTNVQRELLSVDSFVGKALNSASGDIPIWTSNVVGTSGDNLFQKTNAIVPLFNGTTGHSHDGTDGNGPTILAKNRAVIGATPGAVLLVDQTGNLSEDPTNVFWDFTNHRMGLGGNQAPWVSLQIGTELGSTIVGSTSSIDKLFIGNSAAGTRVKMFSCGTTIQGAGNTFTQVRSRGTQASPTTVGSGDTIGRLNWDGYDGTGITTATQISTLVTGAASAGNIPADILFSTNTSGSVTEKLRVKSDGTIVVKGFTTDGLVTNDSSGNLSTTAASAFFASAGGFTNPMTTKGDIIIGGSSGSATRLAGGTSSQWLAYDSSASAPFWTNTVTTAKTIDGSTDTVQLIVEGNGTQTSNIFNVRKSDGTTILVGVTNASGTNIRGTTVNDSAASGFVGEYIESVVSTVSFPTSNQYGDLTSISLTAGDWDVTGIVYASRNGGTMTRLTMGISTTTGNSSTGLVVGSSAAETAGGTANDDVNANIPAYRMSLSATTTVYLKYFALYTVATPNGSGRLSARRVR